jgi:hypothetical protein
MFNFNITHTNIKLDAAYIRLAGPSGLFSCEYLVELQDQRREFALSISEEEAARLFLHSVELEDAKQALPELRKQLGRERLGARILRHAGLLLEGAENLHADEQDPVTRGFNLIHFAVESGHTEPGDLNEYLTPGQQARLQARILQRGCWGDTEKGRRAWEEVTFAF